MSLPERLSAVETRADEHERRLDAHDHLLVRGVGALLVLMCSAIGELLLLLFDVLTRK